MQSPRPQARRRNAMSPERKRKLRRVLLVAGPLVVAIAAAAFYLAGGRIVSTDNAYLQADQVAVSAEVAGPVKEVLVQQNAAVAAGEVLFRIDERPYRVAVQRAQAVLAKSRTDVAALEASYREANSKVASAKTNLAFAE